MSKLKKTLIMSLAIVSVLLVVIFLWNQWSLKQESVKIETYGQQLSVFDSEMTVLDEGHGVQTIVLLTGYGTVSPVLDYRPLINELKDDYRVVVIEPFGYGLSGQTNRPRSLDNIAEEIHEVLKKMKISSFIMMGHSISGYYALTYVNNYPNEVTHFIGIDSSVPNQPQEKIPTKLIKLLSEMGLIRLAMKLSPNSFFLDNKDKNISEQYELLSNKNIGNETVRAEGLALSLFYKEVEAMTFPEELPILLLIAQESVDKMSEWEKLHEKQAATVKDGRVKILPGSHYLHHNQLKAIIEQLNYFTEGGN